MKIRFAQQADKSTVSEMKGASGEMGEIVGEMITEPAKLADFGFTPQMIERARSVVAKGDDEPEFAVVRVEEGWSGSGRLWPAREIDRIVATTNALEPVGHLGHIKDEDAAFVMPDPQTTWVGAIAKTEPSQDKDRAGEMVRVAYFAGYNYPPALAKIRGLIKSRAVRGISWWGRAHQVPVPGKGVEMKDFDLQHLDWARKGAEGMPTSSIAAIASEMQEGSDKMDKDLAQVTPAEFKEHNPNGHALLVAEAQAEMKTQVSEMEGEVETSKAYKALLDKICTALGIEKHDDIEGAITAMKSKVGEKAKALLQTGLAAVLAEKIPGEDGNEEVKAKRALLTRLLPVGEMEAKVADCATDEDAKKLIGEMVDEAFNKDDMIKTLVGEQSAPIIRRREVVHGGGGSGGDNEYMSDRGGRLVGA